MKKLFVVCSGNHAFQSMNSRFRSPVPGMHKLLLLVALGAGISSSALAADPPANSELTNLRCEHLVNPLGVDVASPRLSWMISDARPGAGQSAYRVLVASSKEKLAADTGDVWDSGRVESAATTDVALEAKGLKPDSTYHWKVQIWGRDGNVSPWSDPARFMTGLFSADDWKGAAWIAWRSEERYQAEWAARKQKENVNPQGNNLGQAYAFWPGNRTPIWDMFAFNNPPYDPAPLLRKEFGVEKKIRSAHAYICGLGYYELFLNGRRVGDHVLDPGWTDFSKRALYVAYDVTDLLSSGQNAVGVMLGRGWYNPTSNDINALELSWWRGQPKLRLRLSIEFEDGTTQDLVSDQSWKVAGGPVIYDCPRHGEIYDARMEKPGWNTPGYDDTSWENAQPAPAPKGALQAQLMPPIREIRTIKPVKMFELSPGVFVYQFAEIIAGWPRVKLRGPAGTKVHIVMAEDPDPKTYMDGPANHGAAGIQQFGHILKGAGEEIATMRFSYKSFQTVRVSGDPGPLQMTIDDVEAVVVHTDIESIGEFECSDPLLNRIHDNIRRTFLNNFHSVQTDNACREKYGWMGDVMVTAPATLGNFDMAAFFEKYIRDVGDTQQPNGHLGAMAPTAPRPGNPSVSYGFEVSPVWSSAFWSIPWDVYVQTGNRRIFAEHYPAMKRFLQAVKTVNEYPGKPDIIGETHGDWNAPGVVGGRPPEGNSVHGTAYFYQAHRTLAKMARLLGETADSEEFDAAADRIRAAFNREFFDAANNIYHGEVPTAYRQSPNAVALRFGLVPEDRREAVLRNLVTDIRVDKNGHLNTGLLGTPALFEMLPLMGEAETALGILQKKTFPSLGYMIESRGATTVWEQWVRDTSLNQPALGSPDTFFIKHLAGIRADENRPGFEHAIIKPCPVGDLTWARGSFRSVRGTFASKWERKDGKFTMAVEIPPNTTAQVWVPAGELKDVTEGGRPASESAGLKFVELSEGYAVFEAASGAYSFSSAGGAATAGFSRAGAVIAKPGSLRCEYLTNPLGMDVPRPRFSWELESAVRGAGQSAYQVIVASSPEKLAKLEGDVWDSGRVESKQTVQIEYGGAPLVSNQRYHWTVRVWDELGREGNHEAATAWFETGLFAPADWAGAQWIAWKPQEVWKAEWDARKQKEFTQPARPGDGFPFKTQSRMSLWELLSLHEKPYDPAPLLRKEFAVTKPLERATAYICGLGYYELSVNGRRVSDHVLDPAMTDYQTRVFYVAHDVTKDLQSGKNALGVMLGRGFYGLLSNDAWNFDQALWLGQPKMIVRLSLEYADGTTDNVVSDLSWKAAGGPVIYDDVRRGEIYDAQLEQPGWDQPGFQDSQWSAVNPAPAPAGELRAQMLPPMRAVRVVTPVKLSEPKPGVFVYDMGENMVGWARIQLSGPAGTRVLVRYSERNDREDFFCQNIAMFQEDGFILKGGEQVFEPRFSYKGFRYVQVTGAAAGSLTLESLHGIHVHTDLQSAGEFECSDELVNRIHAAIRMTQLNNSHGYPEDCPTREKMGWLQDGFAASDAALWDFDMAAFYTKWIQDMADGQHPNGQLGNIAPVVKTAGNPFSAFGQGSSPIWASAFPSMVWKMYLQYGDRRLLEKYYEPLKRFAEATRQFNQVAGKAHIVGDAHSDWIPPDSDNTRPPEDPSVYGTAAYFRIVDTVARIADVLGKDEVGELRQWADEIAAAFHAEFFNAANNQYHVARETSYRQSVNALPLAFGMVPKGNVPLVAGNLLADLERRNWSLTTGIVGTGVWMNLLPDLGDAGVEASWKLLTRTDYPSWGHMLKDGGTTIWERWQGDSSLNHPAYGAVGGYLYRHLAGIQVDAKHPGFAEFDVRPIFPQGLSWVKASYHSVRGDIRVEWRREADQLFLKVRVPTGTKARIHIPSSAPLEITERGHRAKASRVLPGLAVFEVSGGDYSFASNVNAETIKTAHNTLNELFASAATAMVAAGSGGNGVAVGQSSLIGTLDASDTFTTGLGGDYRAAPYTAPWTAKNTLEVESNRSLTWEMPGDALWALTSAKNSSKPAYPGETKAGSASGVTENGQSDVAWGLRYGMRRQFVVQFDAVVPTDRVTLLFGPGATNGAAGIFAGNTLSVFLRTVGAKPYSVGLFRSDTKVEIDTGLTSTLAAAEQGRWHNFAAKVDLEKNTIQIFIDEVSLGTIDVDTLAPGFSWDASAVGYGLRSPDADRAWSDNFQIGACR
jgi:alpha-L-rhamnosidase